MFTEPFMQRALVAALILSPLCALLGVFMTARRMSFFSDTVAHGALAGIALGFLWGATDPTLSMLIFSLGIAGAILWLKDNTDLLTDTIMALLMSGSVSLGIIILSMLKGYRGEIHRLLFGDILAINETQLIMAAVLLVVEGGAFFYWINPLALITAHEEMAHVCGIRVKTMNFIFVLMLTVTVAVSIRLIGILLVTSLLVIPSASARNVSRNLRQQIILSALFGLIGGATGTMMSYQLDIPCGPTIVMAGIILFILSLIIGRVFKRRIGDRPPVAPFSPLPKRKTAAKGQAG
jgi:ABC-type Mn2+/Zn2+ transport system permease subunit